MTTPALFLRARAKLNLVLRIVGRRADGYHLLETLYQPIEWGDDVYAGLAPDGVRLALTAENPRAEVPAGSDNLVVRAAERFLAAVRSKGLLAPSGFRFHLHKRVPAGAGLGGGSSDAAAALRLCNALAGGVLAEADVHAIARTLGADVPCCLLAGPQWGRGIGDELSPAVGIPPLEVLLLLPAFGCPTPDVYKSYARQLHAADSMASLPHLKVHPTEDSEVGVQLSNDLEAAAERVRPELAVLRAAVSQCGFAHVRMTGSGSTLFLAFRTAEARDCAQRRLEPVLAPFGARCQPSRSAAARLETPEPAAWPPGSG